MPPPPAKPLPAPRAAAQHTLPAVTPMAFARAIAGAYAARQMDPAAALHQAQIAPAGLRQEAARISAAQMELLSATAMRELDDEGLGAFARRLPWGSYGMLARASLSAPSLGVALRRWCRHHGLLVDDLVLSLTAINDSACLRIEERRPLPAWARELCLVFLLRNAHGLACWFTDSRIPLQETRLPFPAPPHAGAYAHMFPGGPQRFGAANAQIVFDARYLALPLRRDERALQQMLHLQALHTTVRPYRRDRLLVQQVRQALANGPPAARDGASLAALLHVSERTLHRQLKEEGASLQQLKDEVRRERARELLQRSGRPLKQVAAAVGFASEKSFIRAFKSWEGVSPGVFRLRGG